MSGIVEAIDHFCFFNTKLLCLVNGVKWVQIKVKLEVKLKVSD